MGAYANARASKQKTDYYILHQRTTQDLPDTTMINLALSFQSPLLAPHANRIFGFATEEISSVLEWSRALLFLVSIFSVHYLVREITYHANEAIQMPLRVQRLDHRIGNRLPTLPALCTKPIRVAPHTPRIALLLHKWRRTIKWIAALRTEEMSNMPLCPARNDHLALNRRLARFTAGRKKLVKVKMAIEAQRLVEPVFLLEPLHVLVGGVGVQHG